MTKHEETRAGTECMTTRPMISAATSSPSAERHMFAGKFADEETADKLRWAPASSGPASTLEASSFNRIERALQQNYGKFSCFSFFCLFVISPKGIVHFWSCNKAVAYVFPHKAEPSSAIRTVQDLLDC